MELVNNKTFRYTFPLENVPFYEPSLMVAKPSCNGINERYNIYIGDSWNYTRNLIAHNLTKIEAIDRMNEIIEEHKNKPKPKYKEPFN